MLFFLIWCLLLSPSGTISELDKQKIKCYGIVEEGVLKLNYLAYVVFMQRLPGVLARRIHLQASFFDAFADIGSSQARAFLAAKFQRAAADLAAAHLRGEVDPPTITLMDLRADVLQLATSLAGLTTALGAMEVRLNATMEEKIQRGCAALLSSFTTFVDGQVARFTDWRASLRTSFDEAIAAARSSGFLQIGRQSGASAQSLRQQHELLSRCRQVPTEQFEIFRVDGHALCISTFLERSLLADQHYVIRHFLPIFAQEIKKRKLEEAEELGEQPFIAWKEGAWRIQYTETDADMMTLTLQEDAWQRKLNNMLILHRPAHYAARGSTSGGVRAGPYSRPERGGSVNVTPGSIGSFFGRSGVE